MPRATVFESAFANTRVVWYDEPEAIAVNELLDSRLVGSIARIIHQPHRVSPDIASADPLIPLARKP